jgi:hypothetical protein
MSMRNTIIVALPLAGVSLLDRVFGEQKLKKLFFASRHPSEGSL